MEDRRLGQRLRRGWEVALSALEEGRGTEDDEPPAGAQEVVALLEAAPADRIERQVERVRGARVPPDRLSEVLGAVVDRVVDAVLAHGVVLPRRGRPEDL